MIFLFLGTTAFPQSYTVTRTTTFKEAPGMKFASGPGSVVTTAGKEIVGTAHYDERYETLYIEGQTGLQRFAPETLVAFEYFDSLKNKQRTFLVMPFENIEENKKLLRFYEVVSQYQTFAVLSIHERPGIISKEKWGIDDPFPRPSNEKKSGFPTGESHQITTTDIETIYLTRYDDAVLPYLRVELEDVDYVGGLGINRVKTKSKVLDKDLLKRFMGAKWAEVDAYAKANKFKYDDKEGALAILSFYSLISN